MRTQGTKAITNTQTAGSASAKVTADSLETGTALCEQEPKLTLSSPRASQSQHVHDQQPDLTMGRTTSIRPLGQL